MYYIPGLWKNSNYWDRLFWFCVQGTFTGLVAVLAFHYFYTQDAHKASLAPAYHAACDNASVAGSDGSSSDAPCVWQPASAASIAAGSTKHNGVVDRVTYHVTLVLPNLKRVIETDIEIPVYDSPINGACYAQVWRGKVLMISANHSRHQTEDNPDYAAKAIPSTQRDLTGFLIFWIACILVGIGLRVGPMRRFSKEVRIAAATPKVNYWKTPFNSYGTNNWDMLYALAVVVTIFGLIGIIYVRSQYQIANQASADIGQYHTDCDKAGVVGYGGITVDAPCEWEPATAAFHTNVNQDQFYETLDLQAHNDATDRTYLPQDTPINGHCYAQMWRQDKIMMIEANGVRYQTEDNPDLQAKPAGNLRGWLIGLTIGTSLFAALAAFMIVGPGRSYRGRVGIPWSQPASQNPSQPVTPTQSRQPPHPDYWNDP